MPKTRHEQLLAAHWRYDPAQDRYAAPGSPTDGTERWYNQDAAWARLQQEQTTDPTPAPPKERQRDPREQEPQ